MNQIVTTGIVLRRTDFGEADRIVVLLTPDQGKVSLIAKGVRRIKSKLAGGIELFSVSSITFRKGRSDLGTLMSARLERHYGNIVKDIERVQLGYELIRILNKVTEDQTEAEYFDLLQQTFASLNDDTIHLKLVECWFYAQLLRLGGLAPNLSTDTSGKRLDSSQQYRFLPEENTLQQQPEGAIGVNQVKFLRLLFSPNQPKTLQQVQGVDGLLTDCFYVVQSLFRQNISV